MDSALLSPELRGSVRLLWARERWLWGGLLAVLVGFALWVGATGAALNYGADFAGMPLSVAPWTSTTTAVFAAVVALWIVAPAALVTYLVDRYVTNVSGNVHTYYRVEHPILLVAPFLVLFGVGVGVAAAVGDVPAALAGVLVSVGLLALVRTLAYSYRVFSFSVPAVVQLSLFASLAVTAVALLTGVAVIAGRRAFVTNAAAGVGDLFGTGRVVDIVTGTTAVGPVTVSTLLGLAAVLPAGLAVAYLLVQALVGLGNRVREPDVPRSNLRTGQRYPEFAHPVSQRSADSGASRPATDTAASDTAGAAASASAAPESATASDTANAADGVTDDEQSGTKETDDADDVSHTKVFTAPDDGDAEDIPGLEDAETDSAGDSGAEETAVIGDADDSAGDGYECPTCTETFDSGTDFAYCPTCGTELEPR